METIGFYAGSFDPFTNGHLQIAIKAAKCFNKVIIGIAYNREKDVRIDKEKMKQAIEKTIEELGLQNVKVTLYSGLTAEEAKKVLTEKKATIVEEKAMGQRELAYEINKFTTGYYYLFVVEANAEAVKEFDRKAKIDENILRHIIIREEE